jgi:hydrogenase maturation protein HypF
MTKLRGAKLHITGIVQGVGFRPFVFSTAVRFGLAGWVRNSSAGVDIEVRGSLEKIEEFVRVLKTEIPPLARIDTLDISLGEPGEFTRFEIIDSTKVEGAFQPISPDVSICSDCRQELFDPNDRRYLYPFINCTNCGPRFTIIKDLPYDRPNTTMASFKMCPDCVAEYKNPLDRRFHAQPTACPVCGPKIWLETITGGELIILENEDTIKKTQEYLTEGKIVAIKGIGGFHLSCDATNPAAVAELRRRKLRVDKPFAVMMPDMAKIKNNCIVTPEESELLQSRQRPIVLLQKKPGSMVAEEVAPKQVSLGVMLPYTPLHYLIFNSGDPPLDALVMTSGNLSEEPIATGNEEARERLSVLADAFLMHNRDIHTRCDDSVVRIFEKNIYIIRRSRGYAPDSIQLPFEVPPMLATGPELKNTFCLTRNQYGFLSHHIGDMENYETLRSFQESIALYEELFRIHPEAIAFDLHPNYLSSRYAMERAEHENLPTFGIQHHHAHIAACMADNKMDGSHPVIGAEFDGTGYGDDGAIWGGEFMVADYAGYTRKFHLDYFSLPGGDASIKRPARTALALLWTMGIDWDQDLAPEQDLCYEDRMALRVQLERKLNTPQTSSMGRLFDAVAALSGVRQRVNYEAQAAIEFESVVDRLEPSSYHFQVQNGLVDAHPVIDALIADIRNKTALPIIAARFHNSVAAMVCDACIQTRSETGINEVALSGGVWQNMVLLGKTIRSLHAEGFRVLIQHQIPANDGGLSLGQAMVGAAKIIAGSVH